MYIQLLTLHFLQPRVNNGQSLYNKSFFSFLMSFVFQSITILRCVFAVSEWKHTSYIWGFDTIHLVDKTHQPDIQNKRESRTSDVFSSQSIHTTPVITNQGFSKAMSLILL